MSLENVANGFRQAIPGSNPNANPPFLNGVNTAMQTAFSVSPGAANIALVQTTLKDAQGNVITDGEPFVLWLSDSSAGIGLTATTASGAVAASVGADFAVLTTKKALLVQPNASGIYTLSITDTAKTGFYVCVKNPYTGQVTVSPQLVTGNYG